MPNQIEYNINLSQLENFALVGIRRTAIFMGLGLNAARREDFKDYELSKIPIPDGTNHTPTVLVPPGANDNTIKEFKQHFAEWVVAAGLAEVLEHYGLFLTVIHQHALTIFKVRGLGKDIGDFGLAQQRFHENPGIKSKLDTLAQRFGIATVHADWICQLYRLRNAITHNFRTIGDKQLDQAGELVVRWHAIEMFAEGTESKKRIPMRERLGKVLPEEIKVITQRVVREHRFKAGDRVQLDRMQIEEICLFFYVWCIPSVRDSFVSFSKNHGVALQEEQSKGRPAG
jgi:hypothetical protein